MLGMSGARAPYDSMPLAWRAAGEALEIDPGIAEAHSSRGVLMATHHWNVEGAGAAFERSIDLDPNYATSHHWNSMFRFLAKGDRSRALAGMQRAIRLDPIALPIHSDLGLVLLLVDHHEAAGRQLRRVLDLEPRYYRAHWYLAMEKERRGDHEGAMESLERALEYCDGRAFRARIVGWKGYTLARWGKTDQAESIFAGLQSSGAYTDQFETAQIRIGLGDEQGALDLLERAFEERSSFLVFVQHWPAFKPLHRRQRFKKLVSRLSVADQLP